MFKKASIGFRLTGIIVVLLVLTCVAVILINLSISRGVLEREIESRTLPALASEVVAAVDRELVAPATTLTAMAQHPLFQEWIKSGEDPALQPLVYQASRNVATMHNAGGVNVVIRGSLNFYELSGNSENTKKVTPEVDGWFFDFEKSNDPLWVNIHGPNDPHYANMAFINRRIDDQGRFLGIVSVGLPVVEFNKELAAMRIGEQGSTFLVRKNGEIMLHPDVNLNGTQLKDLPGFADQTANILRRPDLSFKTRDGAGRTILVATRELPFLNAVVVTQADSSEMLHDINQSWIYSAGAGVIILLLGFALSAMFVRTITRPLRRIIQYAGDVAAERPVEAPQEEGRGEIGELLLSVNTMVDAIARRVDETREKSVEAEHQTALANAALEDSRLKEQRVGELVSTMLRVSREAEAIAEEVAGASQACARDLEEVSRRVADNDQNMLSVVEAMQRMQDRVEAMTAAAATAARSTDSAKQGATKGEQILTQAIGAIDNVNSQTGLLRDKLESLGVQADSIGAIMTVISDIADQTNLLALNAAIEAARAGDAGRGFAVVADEVRKLAEKTMSATQEVSANIKGIQEAARASIDGMAATVKSVEQATEQARESGVELRAIVVTVDEGASRVGDIAEAAEEQNETTRGVIHAVEQGSAATSAAIADMENVSRSVQDLASRANALRVLVEELARADTLDLGGQPPAGQNKE